MKKQIIIALAAVAGILALAGCNKDSGIGSYVDAGSITIQATIGQMTKVAYNGNASSFTEDDTILLYGWTGNKASVPAERVVDSVTNWFDGTVWIPDKQMRWKNATDAHYFLGIYPVPDSMTSFTAATYKLNVSDYRASDLLVAANLGGIKATDGPVNLTFNHLMAKLNVNLKFASEWDSVPVVDKVTATVKTKATVNYLTGTMTANGVEEALAMPQSVTTAAGYDYTFSCLEIPQTDAKYITITVGARKFVYEASKNIPLNSGKLTTIDLKVGKDTILLNTISVSEWETASNLPGGVADLDPYNGHDYVDLGLPSGLKWATCNVGASKPEEYGDYFAWGETTAKTNYSWGAYSYPNDGYAVHGKYERYGMEVLEVTEDAASANWGGLWRIPTKAEFDELLTNCSWTWKTPSDGYSHNGYLVSATNGNSIFLPAAGYRDGTNLFNDGCGGNYWSSCLGTDTYSCMAWSLCTEDNVHLMIDAFHRNYGLVVRPVCP